MNEEYYTYKMVKVGDVIEKRLVINNVDYDDVDYYSSNQVSSGRVSFDDSIDENGNDYNTDDTDDNDYSHNQDLLRTNKRRKGITRMPTRVLPEESICSICCKEKDKIKIGLNACGICSTCTNVVCNEHSEKINDKYYCNVCCYQDENLIPVIKVIKSNDKKTSMEKVRLCLKRYLKCLYI
tara:strand:- start:66 stop:608 length:543 start_codon:yes stop_codon:yes gene_type:complete